MLWNRMRRKRKMLYQCHSFWLLLLLPLVFGVLAGVLFCRIGSSAFDSSVLHLVPAAEENGTFLSAYAFCARFPVLIYLFSFSAFSVPLILGTLFVRSFLISYSVCGYLYSFGFGGIVYGIQLNLFHGLFALPILVILAGWGILRKERLVNQQSIAILAALMGVVSLIAIPEYWITPKMLSLMNSLLG